MQIDDTLSKISENVFLALSGHFLDKIELSFSLAESISDRFVQEYFYYLAALEPR